MAQVAWLNQNGIWHHSYVESEHTSHAVKASCGTWVEYPDIQNVAPEPPKDATICGGCRRWRPIPGSGRTDDVEPKDVH